VSRIRIGVPIVTFGLAASFGLTAGAATHGARDPALLTGAALSGDTGLRLLVADNPPFVLDVDAGRVSPVVGVPAMKRGKTVSVVGVGGRAAALVAHSVWQRADTYAVRGRGARVSQLGTGTNVWPAADGRGVLVQSIVGSRCMLRQMGLDGRQIRAPRVFPCATVSDPAGGSLGLVVGRTRVLNPRTAELVLQTRRGIWAVAGTKLILAGPENFTLLDGKTRSAKQLRWPSSAGLDQPAVDPRGRFVALAFAVPSWPMRTLPPGWKGSGGFQVLDVWLLDTKTGTLSHVPGMPAFVALKRTSMAWTDDGRLVVLGESNGDNVVAVWRPGQRRLALKTVQLPERTGGSDSFAILR